MVLSSQSIIISVNIIIIPYKNSQGAGCQLKVPKLQIPATTYKNLAEKQWVISNNSICSPAVSYFGQL